MKIVISDDLPVSACDLLRAEPGWQVDALAGRPLDQLKADLADADALMVRSATKVTAEVIAAAPRLRVIARAGTGVDNVDLTAASARGILVMNAPGANSISVAELAMGQLLALSRQLPAADASMKQGKWDKKRFMGDEIRGKVLGVAGLGRIGQEVVKRAKAFEMQVIAHDPFISSAVAADLGVELVSLDDLCARADYVTLHMPSTSATKRTFNAERFARCKKGIRIINTARGDLIDTPALVEAIQSGQVGGAAIDVFDSEPTKDHTLQMLPQVIASPHIAASTEEAQELVGVETATAVRDYLRSGVIRNAVNFPSVPAEEFRRMQPFMVLAERLGALLAQINEARIEKVSLRYYGDLRRGSTDLLSSSVLVGVFRSILSESVTAVNARALAGQRGIELVESHSSRERNFTNLLSVQLHTNAGERWVEGTVLEGTSPRLVLIDGVPVEAALEGTVIVLSNRDTPGVIGQVGTVLGKHGVNIATFALGRRDGHAIGIVNIDTPEKLDEQTIAEIRHAPAVKTVNVVRFDYPEAKLAQA